MFVLLAFRPLGYGVKSLDRGIVEQSFYLRIQFRATLQGIRIFVWGQKAAHPVVGQMHAIVRSSTSTVTGAYDPRPEHAWPSPS